MEEELEGAQGTPLLTLLKSVCKRWLLIGFTMVLGGIFGCVYAFAALPLTKDVYQTSLYLNPLNASMDRTISYYNENVIANVKSYLKGADYKHNVFLAIEDSIFPEIKDSEQKSEQKEAKFRGAVSVTVAVSIDIFVMNQEKGTAGVILSAFVEEAKKFVANMIAGMNTGGAAESDIVGIAVVSRDMVKVDPEETSIQGYIGAKDRVMAAVIGVLLGIVAGAAVAVCLYYFNNRVNSVQMLNSMGLTQVYVDKRHKNDAPSVYDENAVRYDFVVEKQGAKIITFISPQKTEETAAAVRAQAESMRKYYRVAEIAQNGQTQEGWRNALAAAAAENDFILVDAREALTFECAVPAALSDGVTVVIDQKHTKIKQLRHTMEIISTAKLKTLTVLIVNTKDDFVN